MSRLSTLFSRQIREDSSPPAEAASVEGHPAGGPEASSVARSEAPSVARSEAPSVARSDTSSVARSEASSVARSEASSPARPATSAPAVSRRPVLHDDATPPKPPRKRCLNEAGHKLDL
jgi:hypothetical protein